MSQTLSQNGYANYAHTLTHIPDSFRTKGSDNSFAYQIDTNNEAPSGQPTSRVYLANGRWVDWRVPAREISMDLPNTADPLGFDMSLNSGADNLPNASSHTANALPRVK